MNDSKERQELKARLKQIYLNGSGLYGGTGTREGALKGWVTRRKKVKIKQHKELVKLNKKLNKKGVKLNKQGAKIIEKIDDIEDPYDDEDFTDNPLLRMNLTPEEEKMLNSGKNPRKNPRKKPDRTLYNAYLAKYKGMPKAKRPLYKDWKKKKNPPKKSRLIKTSKAGMKRFDEECITKLMIKHPDLTRRQAIKIVKKNVNNKNRKCYTYKYKGGVLNEYSGGVLNDYGGVLNDYGGVLDDYNY